MNLSLLFVSTAVAVLSFLAGPVDERGIKDAPAQAEYLVTAVGCGSPMPFVPGLRPDAQGLPMAPADYVVVPSGLTAWNINGQLNPTLTLTRGQTYSFDLTGVGGQHPFVINSNLADAGGAIYMGPSSATTVSFTPDLVMPSTIYYHCQVHFTTMTGTINLVAPADYTIATNGSSDYVINGLFDPTLTLTRGQTYVLNLSAVPGQHPFVINSIAANAGGTIYAGPASATTITFTPDFVMPATIYYHCQVHFGAMSGIINLVSPSVQVAPKAFLEGPFVTATTQMSDGLRSLGLIAAIEPYTALGYVHTGGGGGETVAPAVLAVTGANAIVDWVVVELRDVNNAATVLASRSALIQRDGDVTATNGTSPVSFAIAPGNYFVALRHRNHLGIMTLDPVLLGSSSTLVDLTTVDTPCYGSQARKTVGSSEVMWAGDVTFNGVVQYTGSGNDRDPILVAIGGSLPTNTISGYLRTDVTMDGTAKYTGSSNDRDPILLNIGGNSPTLTRAAQLP